MASNAQHEPTMEEILASIRKIISEDSTEETAQGEQAGEAAAEQPVEAEASVSEPAPAEPPQTEPELAAGPEEAEVLELTQEMPEEAPEPAAGPEPVVEPVPAPESVAAEPENPEDDIVFETIEDEPAPVHAPAPAASDNDIFSSKSRQALDDAFAKLEPVEPEGRAPRDHSAPVAGLDGVSVEAVFDRAVRESFEPVLAQWLSDNRDQVIDRMKPVIREWLDEHFPALLEDAVQGEVARVVKARGRR